MKKKIFFVESVILILLFTSCKKNQSVNVVNQDEIAIVDVTPKSHEWFYLNENGYFKTDKVVNIPSVIKKPWTEAIRVSSSNIKNGLNNESEKGFAVVNRLGIIVFNDKDILLGRDVNLFSNRTAQNLAFYNQIPFFSVYKSSFFNDSVRDSEYKQNQNQHLFLIQYDEKTNSCYPIINCNNLTTEENSEVTDYFWTGMDWYCSIKTITDVKNSFSYIKWTPTVPLLNISPQTAKDSITISNISSDEFRAKMEYQKYDDSHEQIKSMLSSFDKDVSFYLNLKMADGSSSIKYHNEVEDVEELNCVGVLAKTWSGVLFEDGTFYIKGALCGKYILRGYKPVAIKLPKLPNGFVYSDFVISGTNMYAFFEEKDFYEVGRSGFLSVNLEETLYKEIGVSSD